MILRPGKQHTCQVRLVFCLAVDHFQQQKKIQEPASISLSPSPGDST